MHHVLKADGDCSMHQSLSTPILCTPINNNPKFWSSYSKKLITLIYKTGIYKSGEKYEDRDSTIRLDTYSSVELRKRPHSSEPHT